MFITRSTSTRRATTWRWTMLNQLFLAWTSRYGLSWASQIVSQRSWCTPAF